MKKTFYWMAHEHVTLFFKNDVNIVHPITEMRHVCTRTSCIPVWQIKFAVSKMNIFCNLRGFASR